MLRFCTRDYKNKINVKGWIKIVKFKTVNSQKRNKINHQEKSICDEMTESTVAILVPMWCKNLGDNMPYIKQYGSLSKILCKTYPECWKLKRLREIFKSQTEYTVEQVSKECQVPPIIVSNSTQMCLSMNNYAGTTVCTNCESSTPMNKPALIIGGGPSLDSHGHLDLLNKYRFNGDIFCVTSSLKKVLDKDIIPTYINSLDAEEHDTQFIDDEKIYNNSDKITGIFSITVHPSTNKIFKGNRLFYNAYIEDISHIFHLITDTPQVPTGGNVGTATMIIASILGYNPIVMIGMDLSWETFDDMKRYYDTIVHSWNPNKVPVEWTKDNYKKDINPFNNKPYYIDKAFESYKISTIKTIENLSKVGVDVINCSEQGSIHSKHIKSIRFIDYLQKQ